MGIISIFGPPTSGKTTLAVDLAFAFARQSRSVCLISAAAYSELSAVLRVRIARKNSLFEAYQHPGALRQIAFPADELLFVLAAPMGSDIFAQSESAQAIRQVLSQARSTYDAVLIDCGSGAESNLAAWALRESGRILITTGCRARDGEWHKTYRRAVWEFEDKAMYVCVETREEFAYGALFTLIGQQPSATLPFVPDADAIRDHERALYGANAGLLAGKPMRRALTRYTEAVNDLKAMLEGVGS